MKQELRIKIKNLEARDGDDDETGGDKNNLGDEAEGYVVCFKLASVMKGEGRPDEAGRCFFGAEREHVPESMDDIRHVAAGDGGQNGGTI